MTEVVLMNLQGYCSSIPKQESTQNQKRQDRSFGYDESDHSFLDAEWQQQGFWKSLAFSKQTSLVQEHVISGHLLALSFLSHKQHKQPRGTLDFSNIISSLGMSLRLFESSTAWQVIFPSLSLFFFAMLFFICDLGSQCSHFLQHLACEQNNQCSWPGMKIC